MLEKVVWRFALMMCGAPFVMTCGTLQMLQSYADNWVTLIMVSTVSS